MSSAAKVTAVLFSAVLASSARAEANPVQLDGASSLQESLSAYLQTAPMPKGWFNSKNSLDRSKTRLRVGFDIPASGCRPEVDLLVDSVTKGRFDEVAVLNPQQKTIGYVWTYLEDLGPYVNEWHEHLQCDGGVVVHGCTQARTVSVTIDAYGQDGQRRTYVDDGGTVRYAGDAMAFELPAIQTPREEDTNCAPTVDCDVGIGQCIQSERDLCDARHPVVEVCTTKPNGKLDCEDANEGVRQACKHAANCVCKERLIPLQCPESRCE